MMCLNPFILVQKGMPDMKLPCGRCRWCRVMRSNEWAMRMMHERSNHDDAVFVTLTYREENLPKGRILVKKDLQDFFKRLRKNITPKKIKYYACGEYGERFGRPHYHTIIFGIGCGDKNIIYKSWELGFIKVGIVNKKSCRYVSKYITKAPLGKSRKELEKDGIEQPFQICSRGIGLSWLLENAESVGSKGLSRRGRKISLPRYYVKKLRAACLLQDSVIEDVKADGVLRVREHFERLRSEGIVDSDVINKRYYDVQAQRAEEIKTQDSMHSGKDDDNQ